MERKRGERKCVKCGSNEFTNKSVSLPLSVGVRDTALGATAYICSKCGYVELYTFYSTEYFRKKTRI